MGFAEDLGTATGAAVCGWLANGGNAAASVAVANGLRVPGAQVPSLAAGLGLLALNYGCSYNPAQGTVSSDFDGFEGCATAPPGKLLNLYMVHANGTLSTVGPKIGLKSVLKSRIIRGVPYAYWDWRVEYASSQGVTGQYNQVTNSGDNPIVGSKAVVQGGGSCDGYGPPYQPTLEVHNHITDSGCELTVNFDAWLLGPDGNVRPVVKIAPKATAMASGGIVGGCNFNPIIYVGGGGGGEPPWYAPWVDTPDGPGGRPWWLDLLEGAAGAVIGGVVSKAVGDLLEPTVPGAVYRLISECETNANGEPISQSVESVIAEGKGFKPIADRLDALCDIAQGLKSFKQPICPPGGPDPIGGWVTVNFQSMSDEVPSRERIRKVFSYRDPSDTPEADHVEHWRGFSWRTGPVVVSHTGSLWGRTTVWAETEEEARRVIGHAAAIAGVDLATGSWKVGRSQHNRYGRVGTVWPVRWEGGNDIAVSKRASASGIPNHLRDL